MTSLFITGSTGFIGRRLVQRIDPVRYGRVYCLHKSPIVDLPSAFKRKHVEVIQANILDPQSYTSYLGEADTVVHLAAITGKRRQEEYFSVNSEGTKVLVEQCKRAGVRRFLHISSITVKYPDKSHYYYALSKESAEFAVKQSGLAYTIVRPTIVIGSDSPTWKSLLKLVKLPIIPVFGNGSALIQPIYVDDLIDCLLSILAETQFEEETLELGGPEQVTFENFLTIIHRWYRGGEPRKIHVPLRPILSSLSVLEKSLYSMLPVTRGQLCAFANDGTIDVNHIFDRHRSQMKNIDEMISMVLEG